jgi:hypothetical protein
MNFLELVGIITLIIIGPSIIIAMYKYIVRFIFLIVVAHADYTHRKEDENSSS